MSRNKGRYGASACDDDVAAQPLTTGLVLTLALLLALTACPSAPPGPSATSPTQVSTAAAFVDTTDRGARAEDAALPVTGDSGPQQAPAPGLMVLAQAQGSVGVLAIDESWAYFIDARHGLARVSKGRGDEVDTLVSLNSRPGDFGLIAVDGTSVYWASDNDTSHGLWRANKDVRPSADASAPITAMTQSTVGCLAVDADAVYWLQLKGSWAKGGSILRTEKRGGAPTVLAQVDTPGFGCIAVDDSRLYLLAFREFGPHPAGAVRAVPKKGGKILTLATVVAPPLFLKEDGERVYWAEGGTQIKSVAKSGGAPDLLTEVPKPCSSVAGMALDDANVYFTCSGFGPRRDVGTVWRVAKSGGGATMLADGQTGLSEIAVDRDFIYWVFRGTDASSSQDGGLVRLAKPARSR